MIKKLTYFDERLDMNLPKGQHLFLQNKWESLTILFEFASDPRLFQLQSSTRFIITIFTSSPLSFHSALLLLILLIIFSLLSKQLIRACPFWILKQQFTNGLTNRLLHIVKFVFKLFHLNSSVRTIISSNWKS